MPVFTATHSRSATPVRRPRRRRDLLPIVFVAACLSVAIGLHSSWFATPMIAGGSPRSLPASDAAEPVFLGASAPSREGAPREQPRLDATSASRRSDQASRYVPPATWNVLVLIYRETDIDVSSADGRQHRLRSRMTDAMYALVVHTVEQVGPTVHEWSNGRADWRLMIVDADRPITELEPLGDAYWVSPNVIAGDIDRYAPAGRFDSIIAVWQPSDDQGASVPVPAWGLTLPHGPWSNGAGFSSVTTPAADWWMTDSGSPEEVFVHEWIHQVLFFHDIELDLDDAGAHGYGRDATGSWRAWLSDVMTGQVSREDGFIGIGDESWLSGTPSRPASDRPEPRASDPGSV